MIPTKFKAYKLADWNVTSFDNATELQNAIRNNLSAFNGILLSFFPNNFLLSILERNGCGVLLLLYSAILTRGISSIRSDMDSTETSLLAPHVSGFEEYRFT